MPHHAAEPVARSRSPNSRIGRSCATTSMGGPPACQGGTPTSYHRSLLAARNGSCATWLAIMRGRAFPPT
jgi:hypothetical protein